MLLYRDLLTVISGSILKPGFKRPLTSLLRLERLAASWLRSLKLVSYASVSHSSGEHLESALVLTYNWT